MPNQTPTASLAGTFASNSGSDSRPLTDGKVKSNYAFGSSSKRKATDNQKIRNSGPGKYREFDKPENRGAKIGSAEGSGNTSFKKR